MYSKVGVVGETGVCLNGLVSGMEERFGEGLTVG